MTRIAVALLVTLAALTANSQDLPQPKVDAVEHVLSSWMSKNGIPGLSIAIAVDGKIIFANGYGMADVENFVPAKTSTAYRTASIGKTMTATTAMELVEAGKLDLDAPVQHYCPAFPLKAWPLSTRNLLRHMGGIRHYGGPHDQEEQFSTRHYGTIPESLDPFRNDPLLFEPGTKYSYSTYGFVVAGCVIEGAAGEPYLTAIRHRVFDTAGMTSTRDDDPAAIIPNRAAGYIRENGQLRNAFHADMSNRLPAGGFITTVSDIARFAIAFMDCKLVSCTTRDLMLTPQKTTGGELEDYGLGWALVEPGDAWPHDLIAVHGGSSPGVSGILYVIPKRRFALVILTNLELASDRMDTADTIARIALEK